MEQGGKVWDGTVTDRTVQYGKRPDGTVVFVRGRMVRYEDGRYGMGPDGTVRDRTVRYGMGPGGTVGYGDPKVGYGMGSDGTAGS